MRLNPQVIRVEHNIWLGGGDICVQGKEGFVSVEWTGHVIVVYGPNAGRK